MYGLIVDNMGQNHMVDSIQDRKALQCFHDVLTVIKDDVSPSMPVQQVISFLLVALNEGSSLKELVHIADIKQATMSRHLIDLGKRNRNLEEGFNLVDSRQDPMELRKNQYTLTPKGLSIVEKIVETVNAHGYLR